MRRVWRWWERTAVSVAVVVLLYWPYAGWHWSSRRATGPGLAAMSPTSTVIYRESLMALLVERTSVVGRSGPGWAPLWKLSYAIATTGPGSLVGVLVFVALTRRFGPRPDDDPYTRCRRCGHILCGLSRPRCPECGELI
jgi:hypothetical protein